MDSLHACFLEFGKVRKTEARQLLLRAGEVAQHLYLIEQGAARLFLLDAHGRETSTQFFFEGEVVGSMESLMTGRPSALHLVTMEACQVRVVEGAVLKSRIEKVPALQADLMVLMQQRLIHYVKLYTSAISESPTERYLAMLASDEQKLERIPLHILAAYLGVSAVHLSRIRRKLKGASPLKGG